MVWLTGWRRAVSSAASVRALLQVQRKGDCGSPRAVGSTMPSKAGASRDRWTSTRVVRRPRANPARASGAACNSSTPLVNVTRDRPQARLTREMPP